MLGIAYGRPGVRSNGFGPDKCARGSNLGGIPFFRCGARKALQNIAGLRGASQGLAGLRGAVGGEKGSVCGLVSSPVSETEAQVEEAHLRTNFRHAPGDLGGRGEGGGEGVWGRGRGV